MNEPELRKIRFFHVGVSVNQGFSLFVCRPIKFVSVEGPVNQVVFSPIGDQCGAFILVAASTRHFYDLDLVHLDFFGQSYN